MSNNRLADAQGTLGKCLICQTPGSEVCGPAMLMGAFGCIACGIALGGLAGNATRGPVDACLFLILMIVAMFVAFAGVQKLLELQRNLEAIKF